MPVPTDFAAWLFDLDGVITRPTDVHAAAWRETSDRLVEDQGSDARFDQYGDYPRYVDGRSRSDGIRTYLGSVGIVLQEGDRDDPDDAPTVCGVARAKNRLFLEILEHRGVSVCAGSIAFVRALREHDVQTAVVSASENAGAVLRRTGTTHRFDTVVDGVTLRRLHLAGKPAPDGFLEAARELGSPPDRVAVVEDALAGVAAGRAGRFGLAVGVDRGDQTEALLSSGADIVVRDPEELLPD